MTILINYTSIKSPLRYPGGKSKAIKIIAPFIPPHRDYREPLVGGGAIFFNKPLVDQNWINDVHPGLHAFYITVRDNFDSFAELCREQTGDIKQRFGFWISRRDLMELDGDEGLLVRAVQYFFINRTVYNGRVVYDPKRKSRLHCSNPEGWNNLNKKLEHLATVSDKLSGVKITCQDFSHCFEDCNDETFIYCDPPYVRDTNCPLSDKLYDKMFTLADHKRFADAANNTNAKVLISYDDHPIIHELYGNGNWIMVSKSWKYSGTYAKTDADKAAGIKEKKVDGKELLIMNYEPPTAVEC